MKNKIILTLLVAFYLFSGCAYDNFEAPSSFLSGKIVYNGQAVSVRAQATQLELWQDGYALPGKIPVYISWDGSYSALLFDGEYQMVRLDGAPWESQTDTILISVKGNTIVDVPVKPYFVFRNVNFEKTGNTVVANFTIEQVSESARLDRVRIFLGSTLITDQNNMDASAILLASAIKLGEPATIRVNIPDKLASKDFLYARLGVLTAGVGELYYTLPEKIQVN